MATYVTLVYGGGLVLLIALAAVAGRLGYAFPRAGAIVAALLVYSAFCMWYIIFSDKGDGPGQPVGAAIIGLASLFPLTVGLALAVGAIVGAMLAPNSAAHPEPLKQRSLWHPSSRRPGGRER